MPHVAFTRHLQRFFPTLAEGEVPGTTVREVIDELERRHPGFASYIADETGRLRRHVNIFVGEEPIHDRVRLGDALAPDARVFILQALSGG
ncbi:MAG: MoaD/ThiS family protein [Labilithrix sp.]|nr:MoaD/ThiS family protein [Labilithrix sp.]MBX3224128.1 MoaD/ThiS family protein [Labilithrix sp.]